MLTGTGGPGDIAMGSFADLLKRPRRAAVIWLDSYDYAGRLLAGGAVPWLDTGGFVAWQRKMQELLKSTVASLQVAPVVAAWLDVRPDLRAAMASRARAVYPLKVLLADDVLRAHLVELARGMRASMVGPLALELPSPRAWVALAYRQAHGRAAEIGEDDADSGSLYVADFLRAFGDAGVDVLLLREAAAYQPLSVDELQAYQAVFNVAAGYRWDVGLRLPKHAVFSDGPPRELAFVIAEDAVLSAVPHGIALTAEFWAGATRPMPAADGFYFVEIPPDAEPELVLDRLASLS